MADQVPETAAQVQPDHSQPEKPQTEHLQAEPAPAIASSPPAAAQDAAQMETSEAASADVAMVDAPGLSDHASPAPSVQLPPPRTGTPARTNGAVPDKEPSSSRANSVHPESKEPLPDKAAEHGEPVRRYLNTKVSGALLEGMKMIAKEQPSDPLRALGEFLIKRQDEIDRAAEA